jgi:hypothetical protein
MKQERTGKNRLKSEGVLIFSPKKRCQGTVRRHYLKWRQEKGLQPRCDNPKCRFHTSSLEWNGEALGLILDHIEGNRFDNRPDMLRFLCPNCDSQLNTRGGANKGCLERVHENGFTIKSRDGRRSYTYFGNIPMGLIPKSEYSFVEKRKDNK